MLAFSPSFSKTFKIAAYLNFLATIPVLLVRAFLIFILVAATFYTFQSGAKITYFWAGLLAFDLMIEFFYRVHLADTKPPVKVEEASASENLADAMELPLAKRLVNIEGSNKLSEILRTLKGDYKTISFFLKAGFNKDEIDSLIQGSSKETLDTQKLVRDASITAYNQKRPYIDSLDMILSAFSQSAALKQAAFSRQLKDADIYNIVFWVRSLFEKEERHFWERSVDSLGPGFSRVWEGGWTLETEKYSINITNQVLSGQAQNHLVGKENIILQVEEVLSRSNKRNVILVGEAGVGKTTVVYALAEKSITGQLPAAIKYKRFLEIDLTSLLSSIGAGGVLEERLKNLFTEVSHAGDVVLFIPQIEYLATNEGGGVDITGLVLETVKEGRLQIIGTTTRASYKEYIEGKSAFADSFEVVEIPEPTKDEAVRILEEAAANIERKTGISVTYRALEKTVELAQKYLVDRVLPGKAIDLLDEAAAASSLQKQGILQPEVIEQIVSAKTKTPVTKAEGAEAKTLLNLEAELHKRIIDQEEAINAISEAVRRARTLSKEGTRPVGTFLFLGPTGVGKTETAKALAAVYFGSEEKIIREDMSEFQEESSINRLIGAPPGKEGYKPGGHFTEAVRQNPFTVILLDEFEKAHPKIQEAFLPVLDEGKLEDSSGRRIIFTNTIIIATSNAGAEFIRESIQKAVAVPEIKIGLLEKLQAEGIFKPEFLNRFDDIILYKPLTKDQVKQVTQLMIDQLMVQMKKQDVEIIVSDSALSWLSEKGYDPAYGARPLRRIIQNQVEDSLARKILSGELPRGGKVSIGADTTGLTFTLVK